MTFWYRWLTQVEASALLKKHMAGLPAPTRRYAGDRRHVIHRLSIVQTKADQILKRRAS